MMILFCYNYKLETFATSEAGTVPAQAEERKCSKYCHLVSSHFFVPVAIEISGAIGPRTSEFLWELGHLLRQVTGEVKSTTYIPPPASLSCHPERQYSICLGYHQPFCRP